MGQRESPWYELSGEKAEEFYKQRKVRCLSGFFTSPRGLSLFTRSWLPLSSPPRALVFLIHGYTNDISWTFQDTALRFTDMGFAAFAMDAQGHGQSEGLPAFLPNLDLVAQDFLAFFSSVKGKEEHRRLPCFLFGQSLGGALCLLIHLMDPHGWDGAILVAPMCKISDSIKPRWPLPQVLTFLSRLAPTWAIVPTQDVRNVSFKDPAKMELSLRNPRRYRGKPRLGTALEMLRVTSYLSSRLQDISLPFLVVHGDADVVVDPAASIALYESARTTDKTLKLYKGMRHALLGGEYDEDVQIIVSDIKSWLDERVARITKGGERDTDLGQETGL